MVKFFYNNTKNMSIDYTSFKFNYSYYSCIFYKKNVKLKSRLKSAKKLLIKLTELITIY